MKSQITARFRQTFKELPSHVRQQARDNYKLFRNNPYHPSLHFKKVHPSKPFYSVRIGIEYRTLGIREGDTIIWFWIGIHAEYDKLISRL